MKENDKCYLNKLDQFADHGTTKEGRECECPGNLRDQGKEGGEDVCQGKVDQEEVHPGELQDEQIIRVHCKSMILVLFCPKWQLWLKCSYDHNTQNDH